MTIKISCPNCAQHIEAPGEVVGTVVSCPTCNKNLHVGRRTPPDKIIKIGSYQGACTDTTGKSPVVSRLTLTVARQEQQAVHGKITVTGDLDVDLEFSGTIAGNRIQFVTTTPNKKLTIEWSAEIQDDSMNGSFSATNTGFWSSIFGSNRKSGEWQCRRARFPIIRRLKSFATAVLGFIILLAVIGGGIAFFNSDSASVHSSVAYTPSSPPTTVPYEPVQTYYPPSYSPPYQPPSVQEQPPTGFNKFMNEHQKDIEMVGRVVMWGIEQKFGGQTGNGGATNPSVRYVPGSDSHRGYIRTAPNNTRTDNFSNNGKVNPYTGQKGYNR